MKLLRLIDIGLVGEMHRAMKSARRWPKQDLAYFDLTPDEYTQLKQETYWPGDAGEMLHFWNVEIRVDGVPTWFTQKQKGKPSTNEAGVSTLFGEQPPDTPPVH